MAKLAFEQSISGTSIYHKEHGARTAVILAGEVLEVIEVPGQGGARHSHAAPHTISPLLQAIACKHSALGHDGDEAADAVQPSLASTSPSILMSCQKPEMWAQAGTHWLCPAPKKPCRQTLCLIWGCIPARLLRLCTDCRSFWWWELLRVTLLGAG